MAISIAFTVLATSIVVSIKQRSVRSSDRLSVCLSVYPFHFFLALMRCKALRMSSSLKIAHDCKAARHWITQYSDSVESSMKKTVFSLVA